MSHSQLRSQLDSEKTRHYCAVGMVVVEWTRFESYVAEMIRMLADADDRFGECITSQIAGTEKLLDALAALAELRSPGALSEVRFKKLIDRIQATANKRNSVVHDLWTFDPGQAMRWPTPGRQHVQSNGPIAMPTSEVEALAQEISDLSWHFLDFRRVFLMQVGLWPGQ